MYRILTTFLLNKNSLNFIPTAANFAKAVIFFIFLHTTAKHGNFLIQEMLTTSTIYEYRSLTISSFSGSRKLLVTIAWIAFLHPVILDPYLPP